MRHQISVLAIDESDNRRDPDSVMRMTEWFARVGLPPQTGRRVIASGQGPQLTQLTERIKGVRERHHIEWLNSRPTTKLSAL